MKGLVGFHTNPLLHGGTKRQPMTVPHNAINHDPDPWVFGTQVYTFATRFLTNVVGNATGDSAQGIPILGP